MTTIVSPGMTEIVLPIAVTWATKHANRVSQALLAEGAFHGENNTAVDLCP